MRIIAVLVSVALLGTLAMAAPVKKAVVKPSAAPVKVLVEEVVINQAVQPAVDQSNTRIGALTLASPGGFGSVITAGMRLNQNTFGDVGLAVGQNAAGAFTNLGILLRLEMEFKKIGEVNTHTGFNVLYATNPAYAAAPASSLSLNLFAGLEYALLKNLSVLADLTLLEVTSAGGNTSYGIGAGTAGGTGLGAVAANIVCGIRLYM
jgi:hypothetical protein